MQEAILSKPELNRLDKIWLSGYNSTVLDYHQHEEALKTERNKNASDDYLKNKIDPGQLTIRQLRNVIRFLDIETGTSLNELKRESILSLIGSHEDRRSCNIHFARKTPDKLQAAASPDAMKEFELVIVLTSRK